MVGAATHMAPFTDKLAIFDHNRTDRRIWPCMAATSRSKRKRAPHKADIPAFTLHGGDGGHC